MTALTYFNLLLQATGETLYMVAFSTLFAVIIGTPIGALASLSANKTTLSAKFLHGFCEIFINLGRSIPFIILLIVLIPFTRIVVGTSIGTTAAIVPLSVAAIPFCARLTDNAFKEIAGAEETCSAFGAGQRLTLFIMLKEAVPSLIRAINLTAITLVGYSAIAGAIGAGGLGQLCYSYGYARYDTKMILFTVIILILLVQLIQLGFTIIANKIDKKNNKKEL